MYRTVALLPIKAHSERLPNKNFRCLAGKPLFQWILSSLLSVKDIDVVVINTDARDELRAHGLEEQPRIVIRDRRMDLCGDFVSMNHVLRDDVDAVHADEYVMTHATNPLISASTIKRALEAYRSRKAGVDSLFSVNKVQKRFYRRDLSAINHDPDELVRTQDLELWYEENSCLYIFGRESFQSEGRRIGTTPMIFETPVPESVDIDDYDDWYIAESLLERRISGAQ